MYNGFLGGAWRNAWLQNSFPTLSSVQHPMLIPMIGDFAWPRWPDAGNLPQTIFQGSNNVKVSWQDDRTSFYPRHGGRANIIFADFSIQQREITLIDGHPIPYRVMMFDGEWDPLWIEP